MAVRIFTCPHCEHQLRLGVMHCGRCGARTPLMNWWGAQIILLLLLAGLLLVGGALLQS